MTDAPDQQGLELAYEPIGAAGKVRIRATFPDGSKWVDEIVITDLEERERYVEGLCGQLDGVDPYELAGQLEDFAAEVADLPPRDGGDSDSKQADRIVQLAMEQGVELFHAPGDHESDTGS